MKGLFIIKDPKGKTMSAKDLEQDTNTFGSKAKAKEARNKLNEAHGFDEGSTQFGGGYIVSKGPSHWKMT